MARISERAGRTSGAHTDRVARDARAVGLVTIVLLLLLVAAGPSVVQGAGKARLVGYLDQGSAARNRPYFEAFRQGLRDLGWVEGQTVTVDARFAEGKTENLPALAAELVARKADVIATWSTPAALAAKRATTSIPIVMGFAADPVGSGIVGGLAHPGGNVTGWTHLGLELRAKYLELLKEAVPEATRFGVLWNPANQVHKPSLTVIEEAARRLKVELSTIGVQGPGALEGAFAELERKRIQALVVFPDGMFLAQTRTILALAAKRRLPTMYGVQESVEAGGLMAYGTDLAEMQRQVGAAFVDKILRGARPADLPVAQPTTFELSINLKTARTLGLTIPPPLLLRANHVIE